MSDLYGTKLFERIIDELWKKNQDALKDKKAELVFETPEYMGLPKNIADRLNTDAINQIRWALGFAPFDNKNNFKALMRSQLFPLSSD